jgi:GrpB-like predicted nucleotidyltransferase (UPF0157 family)
MIKVVPYNPNWPNIFEHEAKHLQKSLGENCLIIHHIGSTSVPGLSAKPIIDILAVVNNINFSWKSLESIGYTGRGEINIPFKLFFKKQLTDEFLVHLHVCESENPEIDLNLKFRDYLRNNPTACNDYAHLKLRLLSDKDLHEKKGKRFTGYNLGKNQFIKDVLRKAGFVQNCIRFCAHDDEWDTAKQLRQQYFANHANIEDPYIYTFNDPNHTHFVFYQGTKIIGYAHVEHRLENSVIHIIVINEAPHCCALTEYFLKLIERWLKQRKVQYVYIETSPKDYEFYLKQGYIKSLGIIDIDKYIAANILMAKKI